MTDLSVRLKRILEEFKDKDSKWTQNYVATKVGVARVTYTAYENGSKTPPPDMIKKLADLFDVTTDYLLGRSQEETLNEDEEFEEFVRDLRRWHKEGPKDKEEDFQRLKRIFEAYKND